MNCFKKQRNIKGALTLAPKSNQERVKGCSLSMPSHALPRGTTLGVLFYSTSGHTHVCLCCCCVRSLAFEEGLGFEPSAC